MKTTKEFLTRKDFDKYCDGRFENVAKGGAAAIWLVTMSKAQVILRGNGSLPGDEKESGQLMRRLALAFYNLGKKQFAVVRTDKERVVDAIGDYWCEEKFRRHYNVLEEE